jgi:hypothetical protein
VISEVDELPLADQWFLLAVDVWSGRPGLQPRVLGRSFAAALLAELVLSQRVSVVRQKVVVYQQDDTGDSATDWIVRNLLRERGPQPVRDLIVALARDAFTHVGRRLEEKRMVERQAPRWRWSSSPRWVPFDANAGARIGVTIYAHLSRGEKVTVQQAVLAALAHITGLDQNRASLWGLNAYPETEPQIDAIISGLSPPALYVLLTHTEKAVSTAIATHHI